MDRPTRTAVAHKTVANFIVADALFSCISFHPGDKMISLTKVVLSINLTWICLSNAGTRNIYIASLFGCITKLVAISIDAKRQRSHNYMTIFDAIYLSLLLLLHRKWCVIPHYHDACLPFRLRRPRPDIISRYFWSLIVFILLFFFLFTVWPLLCHRLICNGRFQAVWLSSDHFDRNGM